MSNYYKLVKELHELVRDFEINTSDDPTDRIQVAVDETKEECAKKLRELLEKYDEWKPILYFIRD